MPITFREKERKFREEWLPGYFGNRLEKIRGLVKHLHETKEKVPQVKWFTPHGAIHYQAVEDLLHQLIPGNLHKGFTEDEKFFLLGSAWLHDVGMLRGIMGEEDNVTDDQIREKHHARSEEYIVRNYDEVGVEEPEKEAFGLLARFHRRRCLLTDCPELIFIPGHNCLRLRLLAAYLRLADALHVDQTRAPDAQYAISLAYDIPSKAKLHWLRSKFVLGIDIDIKKKEIAVHLKYPINIEIPKVHKKRTMERTLNSIYDFIVQDLSSELDTVKDVLFGANISYFLHITKVIHKVEFDRRLLRDIYSVYNYYFLLDNPSSSSLYNLMLQSLIDIIELYYIEGREDRSELQFPVFKAINSFLDEIKEQVLGSRQCHYGLHRFVEEIRELIKEEDINKLKSQINYKSWLLELKRTGVRFSAYRYFNKKLNTIFWKDGSPFDLVEKKKKDDVIRCYNIILYGYSELVIKSLCGFRDAVITKLVNKYYEEIKKVENYQKEDYPWPDKLEDENTGKVKSKSGDEKDEMFEVYQKIQDKGNSSSTGGDDEYKRLPLLHKIELEKEASNYFRIFICEGQPKNRTTWGGRTIYHDGTRFAITLAEHHFTNIFIIPDAIASTLIAPYEYNEEEFPRIHFVMVGANGYDEEKFLHSAGHAMIAAVTSFAKSPSCDKSLKFNNLPCLILALITDKFKKKKESPQSEKKSTDLNKQAKKDDSLIITDGWNFQGSFAGEPVRTHVFISQDQSLKNNLNSEAPNVRFYNPREDKIPIKLVDVVITEKAWLDKEIEIKKGCKWNGEYITKKDEDSSIIENESELLQKINQGIPPKLQQRYNELITKRNSETLTDKEYDELLRLTDQIEKLEAERVEYLKELTFIRKTSLTVLLEELKIQAPNYG